MCDRFRQQKTQYRHPNFQTADGQRLKQPVRFSASAWIDLLGIKCVSLAEIALFALAF